MRKLTLPKRVGLSGGLFSPSSDAPEHFQLICSCLQPSAGRKAALPAPSQEPIKALHPLQLLFACLEGARLSPSLLLPTFLIKPGHSQAPFPPRLKKAEGISPLLAAAVGKGTGAYRAGGRGSRRGATHWEGPWEHGGPRSPAPSIRRRHPARLVALLRKPFPYPQPSPAP